jgi:DNA-directed RNA polymerase subunit M/transcription elongation factor TFIIS
MVEKSIQVVRVMMVMHTKDQHTTHNARQCGIRQRKKKKQVYNNNSSSNNNNNSRRDSIQGVFVRLVNSLFKITTTMPLVSDYNRHHHQVPHINNV